MIQTSALNLERLGRIYLLAKIPSYLFRHFRADPSVQEFARNNTVADLFSLVAEVARQEQRTLEQITQAYAALAALTFKNAREVREARAHVSLTGISWAEHILALAENQQNANQQILITPPPVVKTSVELTSATNKNYPA